MLLHNITKNPLTRVYYSEIKNEMNIIKDTKKKKLYFSILPKSDKSTIRFIT